MTVSEHIDALRKLMKERGYDIYIVPTDDFHQSENVGAYFRPEHLLQALMVPPEPRLLL